MGRIISRTNKHHLLYPEKAFMGAGPYGVELREFFVVHMDMHIHTQLHTTIDGLHGIGNCPTYTVSQYKEILPEQGTLEELCRELHQDQSKLIRATPEELLDWLATHLDGKSDGAWLFNLVTDEMQFFKQAVGVVA